MTVVLMTFSSTVFAFYGYREHVRAMNPKVSLIDAIQIEKSIKYASEKYNVNADIILAITKVESHFRKRAIGYTTDGKAQDFGIMQINEFWWVKKWSNPHNLKRLGIIKNYRDYFKIPNNIEGGTLILLVKREECLIRIRKGLRESLAKCTILDYNGRNITDYYERVVNALEEYYTLKRIVKDKMEQIYKRERINSKEWAIRRKTRRKKLN